MRRSTQANVKANNVSDGSTASYYELPTGASELQDLIAFRDMNAQMGEIFRACYRYGIAQHSPKKRDIKKILFYATAELKRLETYEGANHAEVIPRKTRVSKGVQRPPRTKGPRRGASS